MVTDDRTQFDNEIAEITAYSWMVETAEMKSLAQMMLDAMSSIREGKVKAQA